MVQKFIHSLVSFHLPRFFALAPYQCKEGHYSISQLWLVLNVVVLVVMIVFDALSLTGYLYNPGEPFGTLTTLLCCTVYIFEATLKQKYSVSATNAIWSIDKSLKRFIPLSYKAILLKCCIETVVSFGLLGAILYYEYLMQGDNISEWYSWLPFTYLCCVKIIFVCKINWMLRLVKKMFEKINFMLENETFSSDDITEIAVIHENVTQCTSEINTTFSLSLLFISCDSFVRFCYTSYILIVCQLYSSLAVCAIQTPLNAFTFIWFLMQLWTVIGVCHSTMDIAGSTCEIIHKLQKDVEEDNPTYEKLELFGFQLLQKLQLTASGFFKMDYSFLTTIIGLVTTYVIIFVQFRVVNENTRKVYAPEEQDILKSLKHLASNTLGHLMFN